MHVVFFIEEGKLGGPQVQMVWVASEISKRENVTVDLLVPKRNSTTFQGMCDRHDVRYVVAPITGLTKEVLPLVKYVVLFPIEIIQLAFLIRRLKPDVIHAWGGSWQWKAAILSRLTGVPVVWLLNDTMMPGYIVRIFRRFARWSDAFICASHRTQDYYAASIPPEVPCAVVPSMVSLDEFSPERAYPQDEAVLKFGDAPVIGTVANVNPVKGLETLIRAAARLREMGHRPHVVVVGAIPDRQHAYHHRLVALARELDLDRVHFVGSRADVRPMLARLDVYVCSSVAESSPVSVWEAMAMARPVVSTDVGDVARHVRDGEAGFIVPVGDEAAMADRIAWLLADPARAARVGAGAREAAQAFRPGEIADLTLGIYERVCGVRPPNGSQHPNRTSQRDLQ